MADHALQCGTCGLPVARLRVETVVAPPDRYALRPYAETVVPGRPEQWPPPAVAPRRRAGWAVALFAVAAVLAVGGGAYAVLRDRPGSVSAPETAAAAPAARTAEPAAPLTPAQQLATQVERDRVVAESIVGTWVPQIGSKQPGTVADGRTYDDAAIWRDVLAAKARYPDTVLVRSDEYPSFARAGYWVLLVASPSATAAEANAWCGAQRLGVDDCFAKRLSHTDGPQGNTVHR